MVWSCSAISGRLRSFTTVGGAVREDGAALLGPVDNPERREQCPNFALSPCVFPELAQIVAEFALGGIDRLAAESSRQV
jgi:hypothetical protein